MSVMNRANVNRMFGGGRRASGGRFLTGVEDVQKVLDRMTVGAANKISRPAIAKAARFLLKKMKAAVPPQYKDAKKGLGQVVNSRGGSSKKEPQAKVGAGVGIKAAKRAKLGEQQRFKRAGTGVKSGSRGVGMGVNNIHWFILGTDERTQKGSGKPTGKMEPLMPNLVKGTTEQSRMEMMRIIRDEVSLRLAIMANQG